MIRRLARRIVALPAAMAALLFVAASATPITIAAPGSVALAAATASPPSVDEIVARHLEARGGLKKIRSIETLRQTGRAIAGANRSALVTRELKRPARTRFEFTIQGVTAVYISDGEQGWQVSPFDGDMAPARLSDDVVAEAAEQADIEGPLVDWKLKGHKIQLVGRENVNGQDAYKLELTLKSGAVRYHYFDVKNFRLIQTEATRTVRGRPVRIQSTFGDFKKTGGVLFPRRVEVAAAGRPQRLTVIVDKIEINPALNDARFRLPASSQR